MHGCVEEKAKNRYVEEGEEEEEEEGEKSGGGGLGI